MYMCMCVERHRNQVGNNCVYRLRPLAVIGQVLVYVQKYICMYICMCVCVERERDQLDVFCVCSICGQDSAGICVRVEIYICVVCA